MKKSLLAIIAVSVLVISGCGSIPSIPTSASGLLNAGQAVAQVAETVDFKAGEALCADGVENDAVSMWYKVAKVTTVASPATKNQAEVLFVNGGKKAWSSYVIPSHKASKAELTVGKLVFVINGWANYDAKKVSVEDYRQSSWKLERITSVDELFKSRVEVGGEPYDPGLVRIPEVPLE
jgi:hypothetical protein